MKDFIKCYGKDDNNNGPVADKTFTFTAKPEYWHGMWSIPSYDFTYEEDYSSMTVETFIGGLDIAIPTTPTVAGMLYYKLQKNGASHTISIYNVENGASLPITIRIYK